MSEVVTLKPCRVCAKPDRPGHKCILPGLPGGIPLKDAMAMGVKCNPKIGAGS